jgi:hypothetical protein
MSLTPKFFSRRPGEGHTIAVVGDVYQFIALGKDTGGRYASWAAASTSSPTWIGLVTSPGWPL